MKNKKREPQFQSGNLVKDDLKGYYAMDADISLQSVNFATTENAYLNEHYIEQAVEENEEE